MGILSKIIKKEIKPLRPFPFTVNGANLRYAYDMEIVPASPRSVAAALGNAEKVVDVAINNGVIELSHNDTVFGTISDASKCKMVSDFIKRGDPVNAILREDGTINLRFYRDMRKGAENNRQTVVTLNDYKSKARQESLYSMSAGKELGCFGSDQIFVCDYFAQSDMVIGKLPAKIVKMTEESQIRAIYLESIYEDGDKYVPSVRIYWSDKE